MPTDFEKKFREYVAAIADEDVGEAAMLYANYSDHPEFIARVSAFQIVLDALRQQDQ